MMGTVNPGSPVVTVGVTSSGDYAVSTHRDGTLTIWDLQTGDSKTQADNANIYSAFVSDDDAFFMWQDFHGEVFIQNFDGELLEQFKGFHAYGHVITKGRDIYLAVDENWNVFRREHDKVEAVKRDGNSPGFRGIGKLLNLAIHEETCLLLTAGDGTDREEMSTPVKNPPPVFSNYAGVVLWNFCENEPKYKLPGNAAKTYATLSPDGTHVVSVDENGLSFVWRTDSGELAYRVSRIGTGVFVGGHEMGSPKNRDTSGMRLHYPDDFPEGFYGHSMVAVQFISETEYLVFHTRQPFAVLYELGDPFAHAILPLGDDPFPSVSSYARNASIATAPEANLLVTGQRDGGGINVYRYDPDTRTLELDWAWEKPSRWWRP
ncbi:hypothetical protein [Natronocella acetinitrilica]|nr:hypothetical protein [Natronocella acetinitrilica]